ncbi:arylamine N-acetyltransferase [Pseudalkalibacillus sp. SCS-8]|uniref:arylamine N-acetyltransferase n=1 Tax=Pseudalkalibacillus nanhaiensis TaxID=3115291 RepID=UPI0032DB8F5B
MITFQHLLTRETTDRYLEVLHIPKARADLAYLKTLIKAHLHTIPYENFSKYHFAEDHLERDSFLPDTDEFLWNFIEKGWGGTCYPLNIHFSRLLRSLGFECSLVRVHSGHIGIKVQYGGNDYYVDVGYGCPLFQPLPLADHDMIKFRKLGEEIYIRKISESTFEIDRHSDGKSFVQKEIDWSSRSEDEFSKEINISHQDRNENTVMRRLNATIFKPRYCYYVNNDTITRKNAYMKEVSRFSNRHDWARRIYHIFGIEEKIALKAAAYLEDRGIQLFKV